MSKNIKEFKNMKGEEQISMVTAYDYPSASLAERADFDMILVGDSLANAVLGREDTLSTNMDEMIHHTKAVLKGAKDSFVIGDMPFLSYEVNEEEAVKNAARFAEIGADSVKLEGGKEVTNVVEAITKVGIPVMGHVGLNPQRYLEYGGYRLMGQTVEEGKEILNNALALQEAGAYAVIMEFTTQEVTELVTKKLNIPTIGIGCGGAADGQVLVMHDVLGITKDVPPFVKEYADLREEIYNAFKNFNKEIKEKEFPKEDHTFHMNEEEKEDLNKIY